MKIAAVILAAGEGKRMGVTDRPKVMVEVSGKPMVEHLVEAVEGAGVEDVTLVVGFKKEKVEEHFEGRTKFVEQTEQLGTGHAVMMAEDSLEGKSDAVVTCYGDMPLFKSETIKSLIETFEKEKPSIAMLTVEFEDPMKWQFGRITRDENGEVSGIVEHKDCNEEQLKIRESNPSFFIFDSKFLWDNLKNLNTENAQGEYYLTDMIKVAKDQGKKIIAVPVSEESEVLGANTPEQLGEIETIIKSR